MHYTFTQFKNKHIISSPREIVNRLFLVANCSCLIFVEVKKNSSIKNLENVYDMKSWFQRQTIMKTEWLS